MKGTRLSIHVLGLYTCTLKGKNLYIARIFNIFADSVTESCGLVVDSRFNVCLKQMSYVIYYFQQLSMHWSGIWLIKLIILTQIQSGSLPMAVLFCSEVQKFTLLSLTMSQLEICSQNCFRPTQKEMRPWIRRSR